MSHFGVICPDATGHLNPMTALGKELQHRGHQVTIFGRLDSQAKVEVSRLGFQSIGTTAYPLGATAQMLRTMGSLNGLAALRYNLNQVAQDVAVRLQDAPSAIRSVGVDALLIDQYTPGGGTLAEHLGLPWIDVCNGLPLNREIGIPPSFTPWTYTPARWSHWRNQAGYRLADVLARSIRQVIADKRQQWRLPPYQQPNDAYSQLAQLSQIPAELEFPRRELPAWFHFTGPLTDADSRPAVPFPFEQLTGQPIIYASMGTISNAQIGIFRTIATACVGLNVQLVMSLGGRNPTELPDLPGSPLVIDYAPQLAILQQATLTITHGGLNTVLECLANAVPMVVIPLINDQPGTAARIAWAQAGAILPLNRLTAPRLHTAIAQVLTEETYRKHALQLQSAIQQAGGVHRAADIVEQAISTKMPVLR